MTVGTGTPESGNEPAIDATSTGRPFWRDHVIQAVAVVVVVVIAAQVWLLFG